MEEKKNFNQTTRREQFDRAGDRKYGSRSMESHMKSKEKYLKLAQEAKNNGDRVAEQTYLQFADHYIRVLYSNSARH